MPRKHEPLMQTTEGYRQERATMRAAERNGRRMGLDPVFFSNAVWRGRKDFLDATLHQDQ